MTFPSLFEAENYQDYLQEKLSFLGKSRRGVKSQFAKAIECDPAYVSRILEKEAHLSLEQGMRTNHYLGHTPEESDYFLTLVGLGRAGSKELKEHYRRQLEIQREKYLTLSERIKNVETLPEITQAIYYSTWFYAAIDIATSIPGLQTVDKISSQFNLPKTTVEDVLKFLEQNGLVQQKAEKWVNTNRPIYLPSSSVHVKKHHTHWRLKAIQEIEQSHPKNLHYSSVVSISKKDFEALKEHFIQAVSQARDIVKKSKDEVIAVYNIDCFELK